jgi:Zn-finger nucleic acid-binding protein
VFLLHPVDIHFQLDSHDDEFLNSRKKVNKTKRKKQEEIKEIFDILGTKF